MVIFSKLVVIFTKPFSNLYVYIEKIFNFICIYLKFRKSVSRNIVRSYFWTH